MLTKLDYDKIVIAGLESLERDIADCKEYTLNDYQMIKENEEKVQEPTTPVTAQPKTTSESKTATKKESK